MSNLARWAVPRSTPRQTISADEQRKPNRRPALIPYLKDEASRHNIVRLRRRLYAIQIPPPCRPTPISLNNLFQHKAISLLELGITQREVLMPSVLIRPETQNSPMPSQVLGPVLVVASSTALPTAPQPAVLSPEERATYVQSAEDAAETRQATVGNIFAIPKMSQYEKHKMIIELISRDLAARGTIYREIVVNSNRDVPRTYLHEAGNTLIDFSGRQMASLLAEYGLQHDSLLAKVATHVRQMAERDGVSVKIVPSYYYDDATYTLYANLGQDKILKLRRDEVCVIPNGSEGLLFPQHSTQPLDVDLEAIRKSTRGNACRARDIGLRLFQCFVR